MKLIIYGTNTIKEAIISGNLTKDVYISEKKHKGGSIDKDLIKLIKSKNIKINIKNDQFFLKEFGNEASLKGIAAGIDYKEKSYEELILSSDETHSHKSKGLHKFPFYILLDCVTDPHNLGSIVRTANCVGANGIIVPKSNSAYITPSVANVSQGAIFYTDVVRVINISRTIDNFKKQNIWVIGLSNEAKEDIYSMDYNIPIAIVIGSEGKGLRRLTMERCEKVLKIPMLGNINSLNASASFAVIAYEILRQREFKKKLT
jgi:23S rRNA (guanosine2251-2'-O)-methyltransferase